MLLHAEVPQGPPSNLDLLCGHYVKASSLKEWTCSKASLGDYQWLLLLSRSFLNGYQEATRHTQALILRMNEQLIDRLLTRAQLLDG